MKTPTRVVGLVSLVVLLGVLAAGLALAAGPPHRPPGLDRAIAAQEAHTQALLANPHVVGTAVGLASNGQAVVKIYTRSTGARGLPAVLDGVPAEVEVTGDLVAHDTWNGIGGSTGTARLVVFRRSLYCTVGTLGALVKDMDGTVYALSNAHVYANEGSKTYKGPVLTGTDGDSILQPGRVDMETACGSETEIQKATIGTLWNYSPIAISRTANNVIDAAIAKLSPDANVTNTFDGVVAPSKDWVNATLNLAVQKYGRTTGLTQGKVTGVNATVIIKYDNGLARFVNQVVVTGQVGAFSAGGDSGSLIMTSSGNHPVALLFAGGSSTTIGNPIGSVLGFFGLSIVDTNP